MSHDGSSCKSYIKHPTEKERLDNLAFTSFPEDYLPYTSAYQQHGGREGGKAPPYLVWDERRPRRSRKRRRRCCSMAALVSAIALIVTAILAIVAISVYLGVVTNLFRSPVLSLSGKFRIAEGDEFSEELLNNTSYQFLVKAETYQAMVENVLLSSSLEPAFIAARIYAFRPGMLIFFRVYLDRRKLKQDDSNTIQLVESLFKTDSPAFGALSIDRLSVDVDENEEWISIPGIENRISKSSTSTSQATAPPPDLKKIPNQFPPPKLATDPNRRLSLATRRPTRLPTTSAIPVITSVARDTVPIREEPRTGTGEVYPIGPNSPEEDALNFSYGQWKPVPIEDSVSPSFGDQRTPPGRGSVRFVDEVIPPPRVSPPRVNLDRISPSKRPTESKPLQVGVGSVSVLEDPLSHMDPAPIPIRNGRPLRPIAPEAHQRGDVASSIMSSVSLVVRPTNKKNKTSNPESSKLGMAKPVEATTQHPYRHPVSQNNEAPALVRKDHASYRFLEDVDAGSSGEVTKDDELTATESNLFEDGDFSSSPFEEHVESLSSKEETGSSSQVKELRLLQKYNQSSVEYLEHEIHPEVENTDASVSISEEEISIGNLSTVFTTSFPHTSEETLLYEDGFISEYDYDFTDDDTNSSYESITEDVSLYNADTSLENESDIFHTSSAKSDIKLKYENDSNSETTPFFVMELSRSTKPPQTVLFKSEVEGFSEDESDELLSNSSTVSDIILHSVSNKFSSEEEDPVNITDSTELTNMTIPVSEFSTSPMQDKAVTEIDDYLHSTLFVNDSKQSHNESDSSFDYTTTETVDFQVTSQTKSVPPAKLPSESLNIHTLEGHGFHQPIIPVKDTTTDNPLDSTQNSDSDIDGTNPSVDFTSLHTQNSEMKTDSPSGLTDASQLDHSNGDKIATDIFDIFSTAAYLIPETAETTSSEFPNLTPENLNATEQHESTTESAPLETMSHISLLPTTEVEEEANLPSTDLNEGASSNSTLVLSGVAKIVPQLSDLSSNPNDIESNDGGFIDLDDDLLKEDITTTTQEDVPKDGVVEVIRHITTLAPTIPPLAVSLGKHPIFIAKACTEDEIQCDSGECIDASSRCNMRRDCRDNSDEKNCSCSELLKIMGQSQKICDGVEDCQDHSDEQNCPWCEEGQIICPQSKFCVNRTQMCDGHNDCPMGTDEKYCVKLAESAADAEGVHYRSSGYLMVRKEGEWGKLCLDNLQDSDSLRVKLDELGEAVCSTLTYRNVSESKRTSNPVSGNDTYYVISNQASNQAKRSSAIFKPSTCESKEVMRVQCGSLDCGHRPMATSSRRRIVGGNSAASGSWPWQVALYKEGDFQCGAVLISDTWLVSAGHCFFSSRSAHWTARLGLLRRGSELQSPYEQIHRIEQIFLHPAYVDTGFINDIALLKLEKPVLFSDYLRPVCLPLENEDASLWHGKQCSVVGWGKLYEIGHTFPDSLQEVRLPVISTEECRKKIIFLTMYHLTDNMFCAGYERGGRDACLGDSGGPLMCQRDDGRWILLGVTSNGDGCGRPGRPGVYTKVAQYLGWIKEVMESKHTSPTYEDVCEGVRCKLGRCIPSYKICDARWDCSEGSDENNCAD